MVVFPGRGVKLFRFGWPAANAVRLASFRSVLVATNFSVFMWFMVMILLVWLAFEPLELRVPGFDFLYLDLLLL